MLYHNNLKIDLSNCDKEPIHLIGNIQAHGFLLIFDKNSLKLEQASANVAFFLGSGINDLLGKPLQFFLGNEKAPVEELVKIQKQATPQFLRLRERPFYAYVYESGDKIVLEGEPYEPIPETEFLESGNLLSSLQADINKLESLETASQLVADFIQSILDYDRVLIFRFDQDCNSEVIGEKIKPGIRSYQGHHFPASDIPAPARELLKVKHIRHIPDITAKPVAILPYLNPSTESPTDILQSDLRYPSEIHLEYLRNMDVFASLSFSIIVKGKLWGLVSCTNEKPVFTRFRKRQLCDHIVKVYANILISSKEKRDHQQFQHYKEVEKKLIEQVIARKDIFTGLQENELNLLSITEATGAALVLSNQILRVGLTPEEDHLLEITDWLSNNVTEAVYNTRELSSFIESAIHYRHQACGLLALEISRFNKEYILYFKPEIKGKRIWAGNPEKPVEGKDFRIHPRKSFERWEETIRGKSLPWSMNELEVAQILLKDVVAVRLSNQNKTLEEFNEEYQTAAHDLEIKNKKLEDFTRIITHNLRSPLANIQALCTIFMESPTQENGNLFLHKIRVASDNMLQTIDDLNLILKTNNGDQLPKEVVNLSELIEKELNHLDATILQSGAEVKVQIEAPELHIHKVYLESILHNLLSNALKYSSPERKPEIIIRSWWDQKTFCLSVSDNGVGIDLERYGQKIFGIYQTFHQNTDSRGVGLYLTKMQVESLGGHIQVQSEPEKGTTFTLRFDSSRLTPQP